MGFSSSANFGNIDQSKWAALNADGAPPERSARVRWGDLEEMFKGGFLVVPWKFLTCYAWLQPEPLTTGEAMFVLHLMTFKWEAAAPYPSYKTLARRMNVSEAMVRAYARSLSKKGYLIRQYQKKAPNRFDLNPLFTAIAKSWGPPHEVGPPASEGQTSSKT